MYPRRLSSFFLSSDKLRTLLVIPSLFLFLDFFFALLLPSGLMVSLVWIRFTVLWITCPNDTKSPLLITFSMIILKIKKSCDILLKQV